MGTPQTLHRRLFLVPHCTLRLSHLSVGGNTRGLEMVWPTRHVGARLRGLLGPTAHGLLGRRHPGPRLSHMVGWGWGLKYRDSQIFVRGAWHVLSYLGVWSLGLFSPTFFSTSSKKKKKFLKRGKAPGPDNIDNKVLRLGTTTPLFHHLARLFTSSIQLGYIPTAWKVATSRMLLTPDKLPSLTTSYRPSAWLVQLWNYSKGSLKNGWDPT